MIDRHRKWRETNGASGARGDLRGVNLTAYECKGCDLTELRLDGAILDRAKLSNALLDRAEMSCTSLRLAELSGVKARETKLAHAQLQRADMTGANLWKADLRDARLWQTTLKNADLGEASLREAQLVQTSLEGAQLYRADVTGSIFRAANKPSVGHIAGVIGLATLKADQADYTGLAQLRTALREAGLRESEREVTYSIETNRTRWLAGGSAWDRMLAGVRWTLFDATTSYGLRPFRALWEIAFVWAASAIAYSVAIVMGPRSSGGGRGIFRIWPGAVPSSRLPLVASTTTAPSFPRSARLSSDAEPERPEAGLAPASLYFSRLG